MPKISIIPSLIGSIISGALSLTGMSVKGTIFQAHSSQDSVTFLLTEAQNGNYFSFHYELSLFHLGTAMIDFHSSSVLPFLEPLTHTDTMQNAGILVQAEAILRKGWGLSWSAILNIYMYWKCWNARCGRLAMLMGHALFLHVLIKPSPQPQVKLKGWQRTAQSASLYPTGRRVESLLKIQGEGVEGKIATFWGKNSFSDFWGEWWCPCLWWLNQTMVGPLARTPHLMDGHTEQN